MKIPKQFQLGGIVWKVEEQLSVPGAYGACHNGEAKVVLLSSMPKQTKEQTFCHELVHAIFILNG